MTENMLNTIEQDARCFSAETTGSGCVNNLNDWKILIVDVDAGIHRAMRLALQDFTFHQRGIHLIEADSLTSASASFEQHPDIAVAIINVVIDPNATGLDLVHHIREVLGNRRVRIILRTSHAGQAPAPILTHDYDINDYRIKTELTADKLHSAVYSTLRAYRDLLALETNRCGLEQVIHSSSGLFQIRSLKDFAPGVLQQLGGLHFLEKDAIYLEAGTGNPGLLITAASGCFAVRIGAPLRQVLPRHACEKIEEALKAQASAGHGRHYVGYYRTGSGKEAALIVRSRDPLEPDNCRLIDLFCRNVSIAHENLLLKEDVEATQNELIYLLSEAVEARSPETGFHVRRVAEYAALIARGIGLPEDEVVLLHKAMPLHDLGKIGVPDAILHKPGKLNAEEWELMKIHAEMGRRILKSSERGVLQVGAIVASQHHEKWDGSGYPQGLKGEQIHIYGRIAALADVFDALGTSRCYKAPWTVAKILDYVQKQRGRQFEPRLVDWIFNNLEPMLAVREQYLDQK
jgi:HD-GYP domain-containing protein (c-di-GMP phosphodiesterase class II)